MRDYQPMNDQELRERITLDPQVMTGKPVIRGSRLTVELILNLLAHGATVAEILDEYDGLAPKDIQACLLFAEETGLDTSRPSEKEIDEYWKTEIERRIEEVESGRVKTIPGEEVFARFRERFGK